MFQVSDPANLQGSKLLEGETDVLKLTTGDSHSCSNTSARKCLAAPTCSCCKNRMQSMRPFWFTPHAAVPNSRHAFVASLSSIFMNRSRSFSHVWIGESCWRRSPRLDRATRTGLAGQCQEMLVGKRTRPRQPLRMLCCQRHDPKRLQSVISATRWLLHDVMHSTASLVPKNQSLLCLSSHQSKCAQGKPRQWSTRGETCSEPALFVVDLDGCRKARKLLKRVQAVYLQQSRANSASPPSHPKPNEKGCTGSLF